MKLNLPYRTGTVRVSSPYGMRTISGVREMHKGVDLVGSDKTIVAPCDGKIGWAGEYNDKLRGGNTWEWGKYIRIETEDGYKIYLCHMAAVAVKAGQAVKAGDVLGREGTTGKSTGSHCHFEVRYGGKSTDPTPMLGIANRAGSYPVQAAEVKLDRPQKYTVNGLTFTKAKDFRVVYHDANKRKGGTRYCNGGFFGFFKSEKGENFTLPVANLVCDIAEYSIKSSAEKYVKPYISGEKLRISTDRNQSLQFKGKKVSTLIVPKSGKPYVADVSAPPSDCLYAISGVPTVRHGDDVDYYNYVKAQGWDDSCMYATYRNWVGIRDGEIWIITGRTQTKNYIYGMEFWKKVQSEGFDDIICLDGGTSYYYKDGAVKTTLGSREVNNLVLW